MPKSINKKFKILRAKEAGVTKSTLYNHSNIRERIEFLRDQQEKANSNARVKRDEANQDAMIASPRRRIKKLVERIEELEDEKKITQNRKYRTSRLYEKFITKARVMNIVT